MKLVWGERLIREGNVVRVFGGFPVYYLRLRVSNDGGKADGVQVRLAKVERLGDGDSRKNMARTWCFCQAYTAGLRSTAT